MLVTALMSLCSAFWVHNELRFFCCTLLQSHQGLFWGQRAKLYWSTEGVREGRGRGGELWDGFGDKVKPTSGPDDLGVNNLASVIVNIATQNTQTLEDPVESNGVISRHKFYVDFQIKVGHFITQTTKRQVRMCAGR